MESFRRRSFWPAVLLGFFLFPPAVPVLFVGKRRWEWFREPSRPGRLGFMTTLGRGIFAVAAFVGSELVAMKMFGTEIGVQDEHVAAIVAGPVIGILGLIVFTDFVAQGGRLLARKVAARLG